MDSPFASAPQPAGIPAAGYHGLAPIDLAAGREPDGCAAGLDALVRTGALRKAGIDAFIVLPSGESGLPPAAFRQLASCALVRLVDATVWFVRTRDAAWSPERLGTVARVLREHSRFRHDVARLTGALRHELRSPSLELLPPVLGEVDAVQWDLRGTAIAIALRARRTACGLDREALAAAAREAESGLRAALGRALPAFNASAAPVALQHPEPPIAAADPAIHNFLAELPHRAWRLQLARTFPLFLRAAATGGIGSVGETIRTAVDRGEPLVRTLAERWRVTPGAIRCLLYREPALVGPHWEGNVRGLARLLDALRPEDRPGEDPASWRRFDAAVASAERIFRCPPWASPVAQMWLRDAARLDPAELDEEAARHAWSPAVVASVERLRDHLARFLELQPAPAPGRSSVAAESAARAAAARFIASRRPRRLREIAARFERELRDPRTAQARQALRDTSARHPPLLPDALASIDGERIVAPLTTGAALERHGEAMQICLNASYLGPPGFDGRGAARFILGLRHATTGKAVSTAELRVTHAPRMGAYAVEVLQHTGWRNRPPSRACSDALAQAVAQARSAAGQAHLDAAFRATRELAAIGEAEAKRRAESRMLAGVLGRTLGEAAIAEIATETRRSVGSDRVGAG